MKKRILCLVFTVCMMGMTITGCGKDVKDLEASSESEVVQTAADEAETDETEADETVVAQDTSEEISESEDVADNTEDLNPFVGELSFSDEMFEYYQSAEWQGAYKKVIEDSYIPFDENNSDSYYQRYCLYDIDKNGIPELLLTQGKHELDCATAFYYFDGTQAVFADELISSRVDYYSDPDTNGILEYSYRVGYAQASEIKFENNQIIYPECPLFTDEVYTGSYESSELTYIAVSDAVSGAEKLTLYPLTYRYGLISYVEDKPLLQNEVIENEEFEEKVQEILSCSANFQGLFVNPICSYNMQLESSTHMLGLLEKDGLFEDTEGETSLHETYFCDLNGDGMEECLAVYRETEFNNKAYILFTYQNDNVYGYIMTGLSGCDIEVVDGHAYRSVPYVGNYEMKFHYFLDQFAVVEEECNHIVWSKAAKLSLDLMRQHIKDQNETLGVMYLGYSSAATNTSEQTILYDATNKYYQYDFISELGKCKYVTQPGGEVYLIVPVKEEYEIEVYNVYWGDYTDDGMPERGNLIYKAEPGAPVLVRGNQSEIVSNIEIVINTGVAEYVYNPCLSGENGMLQLEEGVWDCTQY